MTKKRIEFIGSQDYKLSAILDMPDNAAPRAYAIFAHCFTCSKDYKAIGNINLALTNDHIAVLRFDFTGLGDSEGDFSQTNFTSNVEDLLVAADYLKKNYKAPQLLIGHSLGGAAVIKAASQIQSCRAVTSIAAPFELGHLSNILESRKEEIERDGTAIVNIAGRRFRIGKQFFDDLKQNNIKQALENLNLPLIIFHSPVDKTVNIDNAAKIFMAAHHPKSYISLDKADHLLTNENDSRYTGAIISTWACKYLVD